MNANLTENARTAQLYAGLREEIQMTLGHNWGTLDRLLTKVIGIKSTPTKMKKVTASRKAQPVKDKAGADTGFC